jgi:hypothetical protein
MSVYTSVSVTTSARDAFKAQIRAEDAIRGKGRRALHDVLTELLEEYVRQSQEEGRREDLREQRALGRPARWVNVTIAAKAVGVHASTLYGLKGIEKDRTQTPMLVELGSVRRALAEQ